MGRKKVEKVVKPEFGESSPTYEELLAERDRLSAENEELKYWIPPFEYQQTIDQPPVSKTVLWDRATSGDKVTTDSWHDQWIRQIEENCKEHDVCTDSAISEVGKSKYQPVICAGSGPSLRRNVDVLAKEKGDIKVVSCLHNYGYFLDKGVDVDYYLNLDAGDITVGEMPQGGSRDAQYYWDSTKDKMLIAAITSYPEVIQKWKGPVRWFCPPLVTKELIDKVMGIIGGKTMHFNVGGNTLGACVYMAKAVLGANPIAFVGADFSFSLNKKFHPFDTPYDQQYAGVMRVPDVFGYPVGTWPSYYNFAQYFTHLVCGGNNDYAGLWYNCTEGGILGAFDGGNIAQIKQMPLREFLKSYNAPLKTAEVYAENDDPIIMY